MSTQPDLPDDDRDRHDSEQKDAGPSGADRESGAEAAESTGSANSETGAGDAAVPPERLPESEQVPDEDWADFVRGLREQTASVPGVSAQEIDDVLDDEDWRAPEPEPVGWRTAPPSLVLGLVGSVGGLLALLLTVLVFRSAPGWVVPVLLTVILASAVVLFSRLPGRRDPSAEAGEV